MVSLDFFIDLILPAALWHWGGGSTESLTEMSTRKEDEGKGGRGVGLTTLRTSGADCLEIWEPQRPEALRACAGIALPFTSIMRQGRHKP
jgi:hypothetical protein